MRTLKFRTGVTIKLLAKEWDLCEQRVGELSAEASRKVRAEIADPNRVQATVCTVLERIMEEAMADGDRRSAIDAAKQWAIISGAAAAVKHEVAQVPARSADELLRVLRQRLTELEELRKLS